MINRRKFIKASVVAWLGAWDETKEVGIMCLGRVVNRNYVMPLMKDEE